MLWGCYTNTSYGHDAANSCSRLQHKMVPAPKDIFKDDTLDSLKNEIEVETTNKKNNKFLIYAAVAAIIILIIYLNN